MPITPFDLFLVFVLVVGLPLWARRSWTRLHRAIERGQPRARIEAYRRVILVQWSLVVLLAAHWFLRDHTLAELRLTLPTDTRGLGAVLVAVALAMFVFGQARAALGTEENRAEARKAIAHLRIMLPHTPLEYAWFRPVAWTAGICEEILFRGYLPWFFALWTPTWAAFLLATVAFGVGHAYQGPSGILKTTAVGALFAALTWASGSIVPAVIVHVAIDAINGGMAFRLIHAESDTGTEA